MSEPRRLSSEYLAKRLEAKKGEKLIPPTETIGSLSGLSPIQLRERYLKRYEIYLDLLRRKDGEGLTVDEESWLSLMGNLEEYIAGARAAEAPTLRPRQMTVFEDIHRHFENGEVEGYIKLPTGVGKTVLFVEFVEAMNVKSLVVVPTKELVTQTEEKFRKFAEGLDVGVHYSRRKDVGRQVTVITYDSLLIGLRNGVIKPEAYSLLILDEVHESLSPHRARAVERFEKSFKLGFSATPAYSEVKNAKKLLGTEIHAMEPAEAVREGLLCGIAVVVAQTDVDLSSVEVKRDGTYNQDQYEKALNNAKLTKACVDLYQKAFLGERAMAFCAGVTHAKDLAVAFRDAGVTAEAVYGEMDDDVRQDIIRRYRLGEIEVLTNDRVLVAGVDVPEASLCFNLADTESPVRAPQRAGRVMRLDENKPDKIATVVEFVHKDRRNHKQLLYSQILDGSFILPTGFEEKFPGVRGPRGPIPKNISIQGIKVIVDAEEVMRITKGCAPEVEREAKKLSWGDFVEEVRALNIQTADAYDIEQKKHDNWPDRPDKYTFYRNFWKDWPALFGKEKDGRIPSKKPSWEVFLTQLKAAGIKNGPQYNVARANHLDWPRRPEEAYKTHWLPWKELMGEKKVDWRVFVHELRAEGIRSEPQYRSVRTAHPTWPGNPADHFSEWKSWPALWEELYEESISKEKLDWNSFLDEVKTAGVQSEPQYRIARKTHKNWPANPADYYDAWESWPALWKKLYSD